MSGWSAASAIQDAKRAASAPSITRWSNVTEKGMRSCGTQHYWRGADTGNISMFQHAEHWIPILGKRTKNIHLKEFTKKGTDYSLEAFRPLLDGTTNWPAVTEALDQVGYRGYLTFEYFHPYQHYPEALI